MRSRFSRSGVLLAAGGILAAVGSGAPAADLIQKAAGIKGGAAGLGQIVQTVNNILSPVLVTSLAVGTLAMIAGGAALMLGHSRAMRIVGGVVAGLILIGGAKGIVA